MFQRKYICMIYTKNICFHHLLRSAMETKFKEIYLAVFRMRNIKCWQRFNVKMPSTFRLGHSDGNEFSYIAKRTTKTLLTDARYKHGF